MIISIFFTHIIVIILTMDPHPDDRLARIIKMFRAYNGSEETLMSKQKLTEILNKQANINLHHGFNPNIL